MSPERKGEIAAIIFGILCVVILMMFPHIIPEFTAEAEAATIGTDDEAVQALKAIATRLGEIKTSIDNLARAVKAK